MPLIASRVLRPALAGTAVLLAAGWCAASPALGAISAPAMIPQKQGAETALCEVRAGVDGRPLAAWVTSSREAGRWHKRAWLATVDQGGKLTGRELIYHVLDPPYPKKGFGWNASCPTLIPGPGAKMEVAWQRTKTSYYPSNARVGVDTPSTLVRRARSASGKWGPVKTWKRTAKASYFASVETANWIAGEGGAGYLLVERRMKSGATGRLLELVQRDRSGRWGPFVRDHARANLPRLQRTVTFSADRAAELLSGDDPSVALSIKPAGAKRFGAPRTIAGPEGCRRINGPDERRIASTASAIFTAWPCKLAGGSSAIAFNEFGWDGTLRATRLIADHRPIEAAAVAPTDPYPGPVRPELRMVGLAPAPGGGVRLSWLRNRPYALASELPDVYEAVVDGAGAVSERIARPGSTLASALPFPTFVEGELRVPAPDASRTPSAESFVVSLSEPYSGNPSAVRRGASLVVQRSADGAWAAQLWQSPSFGLQSQPAAIDLGGELLLPVGDDRRSGLLRASS